MNPWDIRVHRASDGKERLHFRVDRAHDSLADPCLKWSTDGSRLGFVDSSRAIAWDADGGAVLGTSGNAPAWLQLRWLRSDTPPVDPELRRFAFGHSILDLQTSTELDSLTELSPGTLTALSWSPDGGRLALCTGDTGDSKVPKRLFVWTLPSPGECVRIWPASETRSLLWSPDSKRFSAMKERFPERGIPDVIRIGDAGRRQWTIAKLSPPPSTAWVTFGEMSPRGERLALAYSDGAIEIIDVATGTVSGRFTKHADQTLPEEGLRVLVFSPSGSWLASVDVDSRLFVWNTTTGAERWRLDLGGRWNGFPPQIAWTPDEKYLAISFHDGSDFRVNDGATGKELLSRRFAEPVVSFGWRPDGQQLTLIQGDDAKAIQWDWKIDKSEEIARNSWGIPSWRPDGRSLALGQVQERFRGKLRLWNPQDRTFATLPFEAPLMPGQSRSLPVAWRGDSRQLAILDDRGGLMVWDTRAAREVPSDLASIIKNQAVWGFSLAWTTHGLRMAVRGDRVFEIWDAGKKTPALRLANLPSRPQFRDPVPLRFEDAAWSPDGQRLAAGDSLGRVSIYDASTGRSQAMLPNADEENRFNPRLAWSPDGRTLAIARGEDIHLWDTASWKRTRQMSVSLRSAPAGGTGSDKPPKTRRMPLSTSRAGRSDRVPLDTPSLSSMLARATAGGGLQAATRGGEALTSPITWLGWDPRGRRLATLSPGPPLHAGTGRRAVQITIFDARSGRKESVVTNKDEDDPDPSLARSAAWSPDGRWIALAGSRGVPVWEAATGKEAYRLRVTVSRFELPRSIGELIWSADGSRLIAQERITRAAPDGPGLGPPPLLRVWDTGSHEEVLSLTGAAANLLFSPDGRWMHTGSLAKPAP
jgi:WD40 repeat protein